MKLKFRNVSGISLTPKGIVKSIFAIIVLSIFSGGYNLNTCIFWMAFMIVDSHIGKAFIIIKKPTPSFWDKLQIPGITPTREHLSKIIFTVIMFSMPANTFIFNSYVFWASYLIINQFGERIAKGNWNKEIGLSLTDN